jgi:hypothetical protein
MTDQRLERRRPARLGVRRQGQERRLHLLGRGVVRLATTPSGRSSMQQKSKRNCRKTSVAPGRVAASSPIVRSAMVLLARI